MTERGPGVMLDEHVSGVIPSTLDIPQTTPPETVAEERAFVAGQLGIDNADGITLHDDGSSSRAYVTDDGIVYKFPRSGLVTYAHEAAALMLLGTMDHGVATQHLIERGPDDSYLSYRGVPGVQLTDLLADMGNDKKEEVGGKIGAFLEKFHKLDLPGVSVVSPHDEMQEYLGKINSTAAQGIIESEGRFSREERAAIDLFFTEILPERMIRLGSDPCLSHGDLGLYNVMLDAGTNGVGVIDFGNVGVYDRSKDFIDVWDETILEAMLKGYGVSGIALEELRAKIAVRNAGLTAVDLAYYHSKGEQDGIDVTVKRLRTAIGSSNIMGGV